MRALIVGVDGVIGQGLAAVLDKAGWAVCGTSRRGAAGALPLDLADPDLSGLPEVDVCFLCAALSKQAECTSNPSLAERVNVMAPARIAAQVAEQGGRSVLLSSSTVFDGHLPLRMADDSLGPQSAYGAQKAAAERAVLDTAGGTVVRLTKVMTPQFKLIVDWITALRGAKDVQAFHDLYFSPIALADVVETLWRVAETRDCGIFQCSGPTDISYVQAGRHLAQRLGVDINRVLASSAENAGMPAAYRPAHTTMDATRAEALLGRAFGDPFPVLDLVFGLVPT